ncbi:lipid II flippase MurJ [Actinomyces sp. zg296]|uniref:lipid II flippase MurJ n=1 Tax=Actinomyces sp. zg296 TaxID=2609289 RepID=UPI001F44507F|nr:lipid II flippase MurJ [Actinomyces sp. zg296]
MTPAHAQNAPMAPRPGQAGRPVAPDRPDGWAPQAAPEPSRRRKAPKPASIMRSSVVMMVGTMASRLLGLVRNALLIAALGATASGAADAFNIANTLPNQLYNMLVGGILNAVLVPQIVRALRRENGEEVVNRLLTAAGTLILAITALLTLAAPFIIYLYGGGLGRWLPVGYAFAFWCMPQVFFYGLYALWGQVLNARHVFGPYMWAPVVNNIISIASLIAYIAIYGRYAGADGGPAEWDAMRITLIAGTTTLGIVIQALVLYFPLRHSGFTPRIIFGVRGLGLGDTSKIAGWALIGIIVAALGDWAVMNLGSRAVSAAEKVADQGIIIPSTTMYNNALLIYILPQSLVTTSVVTALFTRMSEKAAANDGAGVRDDLSLGLRSVAVFTVLASAGIAVLATPALQAFVPSVSLAQARAAAPILVALAMGIVVQGIWFTTQRVLLAYGDTRRLVRADITVGVIPVVVCLLTYFLAEPQHWMLWAAISSPIAQAGAVAVVVPLMRRHLPDLDSRRVISTHLRLIGAVIPAVVAGIGVRELLGDADGHLMGAAALDAIFVVLTVGAIMTLVYLAAARALRIDELAILMNPVSGIVTKAGRALPGGAGRALTRLGGSLRMAPARPAPATAAPAPAAPAPDRAPAPAAPPAEAMPSTAPAHALPESVPPAARTAVWPTAAQEPSHGLTEAQPHAQPTTIPVAGAPATGEPPTALPPSITPAGSTGAFATGPALAFPGPLAPAAIPRSEAPAGKVSPSSPDSFAVRAPGAATISPNAQIADSTGGSVRMDGMDQAKPIGSGRYALTAAMPATLPRIVRHLGRDAILGREVVVLTLSGATPHRDEILDAASRAALIDDARLQRIYDVEHGNPAFIVSESVAGRSFGSLVREGLSPAQVRAIVGEAAQALEAASRRGLHHLNLAPESVRVMPDGTVRISGVGIEAAALDLEKSSGDPLDPDRADARSLVELLYFGLTRRWPGKRAGIAPAPTSEGMPARPSSFVPALASEKELDDLAARSFSDQAPISASEVAHQLGRWDTADLRGLVPQAPTTPGRAPARPSSAAPAPSPRPAASPVPAEAAKTVLGRLRGLSASRAGALGTRPGASAASTEAASSASEPATSTAAAPLPPATASAAPLPLEVPAAPASAAAAPPPPVEAPTQALPPARPAPTLLEPLDTSGSLPRIDDESEDDDAETNSRVSTGIIVGLLAIVLVVAYFAITNILQLLGVPLVEKEVPAARTVPSTAAAPSSDGRGGDAPGSQAPITITGAKSLSGQHPELEGRLVDGDTSKDWHTQWANQPTGLGNVSIAVTLKQAAPVSGISLQGTGQGGHVQIRATSAQDPQGGTLLAEGPFTSGATSFSFGATTTDTIVIVITELPVAPDDGKNKATITEITLR